MLDQERLRSVKQACSRTTQTSGADFLCARGASPSMRERRITAPMMPYLRGKLQVHGPLSSVLVWDSKTVPTATLQGKFEQCDILRRAFYQFFKTTLDIGICALPPCAVCLFFKPDYAKGS